MKIKESNESNKIELKKSKIKIEKLIIIYKKKNKKNESIKK